MDFKLDFTNVSKESLLNDLNSPLVQWVSLIIVSITLYTLIYEPYLDYRTQMRDSMFADMKKIERLERIKNSRDNIERQSKTINEQ